MKDWLTKHQDSILRYGLLVLVFLIGLALPSPFFQHKVEEPLAEETPEDFVDTTNMVIDGGLYTGSITKADFKRNGYGQFKTNAGTDKEAIYEGEWKEDLLKYGRKTTRNYVYEGRFNAELDMDGFGIVQYSEAYMEGKSKQGMWDSEIVATYVGNWSKNTKQGLGRAVMKDGSMEFGRHSNGSLKKPDGANYVVGKSVYGIDASRWQTDIDWNNLALYCDKNGNVLSNPKPDETTFMQPVFFVYLKATGGVATKEKMYEVRMIEAKRHGIVRGTYHYLSPQYSVDDQLRNFFGTAQWAPGDLPPALDLEWNDDTIKKYGAEQMRSMALEWLEKVEDRMGVRPIIYTIQPIWNNYLNDPRFKKYKYWIARFHKSPDRNEWKIWQMSDTGLISGCKDKIDIDIYCGDYDSFVQYLESIVKPEHALNDSLNK